VEAFIDRQLGRRTFHNPRLPPLSTDHFPSEN
jgi:hypothetical protein